MLGVFEAIAAEGLGPRYSALLREHRAWLIERFGAGEAGELPLVSGEAFDATWWNVVLAAGQRRARPDRPRVAARRTRSPPTTCCGGC